MESPGASESDWQGLVQTMTCRVPPLSRLLWITVLCCHATQLPNLADVEHQQDMEKRSRMALEFAHYQVQVAVNSFKIGNLKHARQSLDSIGQAVELSLASLEETGKHPRKHPKHYKRAEIQTRKLVQRLKDAKHELHYEQQLEWDVLIKRVEDTGSRLLLAIMSPKK